ncbi:MAG TPA: hypothetical protein VMU05_00725 [Dongiaceae bacterium]|nr:hypothetical protein [Dongiaceae bacterium]
MPADCKLCSGTYVKIFNGEVAIHFPGRDGLNKPIVWVFPQLRVCPNCGFAEFVVPERELRVLVEGKPAKGAVVFDSDSSAAGAHAA